MFSVKKRYIFQNEVIFEEIMNQNFDPKLQQILRQLNLHILRKTLGIARKLIFLCGGVSQQVDKKKLKIAPFTEAPFMVKSDF